MPHPPLLHLSLSPPQFFFLPEVETAGVKMAAATVKAAAARSKVAAAKVAAARAKAEAATVAASERQSILSGRSLAAQEAPS